MKNWGYKIPLERRAWITSDLHFHHKSVIQFCNRPFSSVEEMNDSLIDMWNNTVNHDDLIFHLGDFSFKGKKLTNEIIEQLNGEIIFIYGNHDKVLRNQFHETDKIHLFDMFYARRGDNNIHMCHYPIARWNNQHNGSIMLHGHTHNTFVNIGKSIDVGYDKWHRILDLDDAINISK